MNSVDGTAVGCILGGFATIGYAFYYTKTQISPVQERAQAAVDQLTPQVVAAATPTTDAGPAGIGGAAAQHAAIISPVSDYVKALAELSKNLASLTPAV